MLPRWDFQNQVNTIGGLVVVLVAGYFIFDATRSREAPGCGTRYPIATLMALQRPDGALMTPAELQARIGFDERGIVDKTKVRTGDQAGTPVLDVTLGGAVADDTGTSFPWSLAGLYSARSACMGYRVLVPADFDYASGGTLPGLFGTTSNTATPGAQSGFSARIAWDSEGRLGMRVNLTGIANAKDDIDVTVPQATVSLARGRWVAIEQEVVLNSPNAQDGALRLWVDGRLAFENTGVAWRGSNAIRFVGALVEVDYIPGGRVDKKSTQVSISPLRMSWRDSKDVSATLAKP